MKKLVRIFAIVFVISVLLLAVTACNGGCNGNHSWSSGNVTKQPTCTEVGEITFVCLECGEIRITTIDKVEHSWNDGVVTKDPTCTSVGEKTFECSVCHTTKTEELAFCEHTYLWNEEISATCTEKGIAAHFACTVCGGLFDANKVATTAQALEISAAHDFGKKTVVTEATCAKEGLAKQICSICGHEETSVIPKTEQHVVATDSAVSATCTQTGLTEGSHCEVCGTVIVAQKVVPVTAHSWSAWATTQPATCTATGTQQRECSVCGKTETSEIAKLSHTYQITVVAPTCTEGGYTTHKCTRCGNSFTDSETAALQHNYVATVKAPTCTEGGYTTHACSRCGNSFTDSETPALGHTESGWIVDKAPTCLAKGLRHTECTVCHQTITTEEIATTAHTFGESQTFKPTCYADGYTFHTCQVCGLVEKFDIVPAAHRVVVDQAVEPTCTKTGLTEGSHCSFCGTVLVAQQVVAKVAHTEAVDAAVAPTCSATGLTEGSHCEVCGEALVAQQIVEKLAHTAVTDSAVAATCTATGLTEGSHCSVCNEIIVAQQIVEKLAHTAVTDSAVAATCTATGLTEGSHCSVCNTVLVAQQVIPATGHTAVTDSAVAATCSSTGLTEGSHCSVCNEILVAQQIVEKLAHTAVTDIAVSATCTETGLTEGSHCSVCNTVLVAQQVIPATGHTAVTDSAVAATCSSTGLTEGSHCSVCNEVLVAQQIVEKLAHTAVTDIAVSATCTATGLTEGSHCSVCGEVIVAQQVVPATGHAWGSWKTVTHATCTQQGEKTRVCAVCDETETQRILPVGHTQIQLVGTPATCTQDGISNGVICAVCNTIIVAQQTLPALGHSWQEGYTTNDAQHWKVCTREGCDAISELANHDHSLFCMVCGWVSELACFKFEAGESYAYFQTLSDVLAVVPTDNTEVTITLLKDASGSGATIAEGTNINWNLANHTYTVTDGGSSLFAVRKAPRAITVAFTLEEGSALTIANGTIALGATSANVLFVQNNTLTLQNVTLDASTSTAETTTALSVHIGTTNILENVTLVSKNGEAQGVALEMMFSKAGTEINVAWNAHNAPTMDGKIIYGCKTSVYQDDWVKKVVFVVGDENGTVSYSVGSATAVTPDNESVSFDGLDSMLSDKTMVGEVHTHNWNDGETTLAPTCTETGVFTYTCTGCGATKTTVLNASGHTLAAAVEENRVEATCTEDGHYDSVVYCSVCDAELSRTEKTIPAIGHDLVHHDAQAPTCTEIGWEAYDTCSRCDYTTYVEKPATGHNASEWIIDVNETCTTDGSKHKECTVCHVTLETVVIDKLGHDLVHHDAQAPTCTEIGWDAYDTCSRCDYTTYVEKPATGHNASEWIIDVNETCTTDGSKHKECTVCNVTLETVVIDKLGHDYDAVVTAPTCSDQGYTTHTCSRCDDSYVDSYVDATGHSYGEWTEIDETEHKHVCSVCGAVETASHSYGAWEVDDVNGGHSRTCSDCLATQNQAHNWNGDVCSVCECAKYENSWKLVADSSTLQAGDKIVIVCKTKNKIAGTGTSYLASIDVTLSSDQKTIASLPEGTLILTLGGSEGAWTLASPSGQLLGATAVKKLAWDNGKTTWSISIENNNATIQNGTDTYGRFLYNAGNSPRFTTYTSATNVSMLLPQIYRLSADICRDHTAGESFGWDENNHWHICDNCGKAADTAVAHNPTEIPAVTATCTEGGFTAGTKCADCGFVVTAPSATPALGHNVESWTSNGDGTHSGTCNRCNATESQACVDENADNHCDLCGEQMEETYDITVQYTVGGTVAACPTNVTLAWTDELGNEAGITNLFANTVRLLSVDVPSIYTVTVSGGETTESGWKFTVTENITVTIELTKVELDQLTLTFDDVSKREQTSTDSIWKESGIIFTNTGNVNTYANPVRCYSGTTIKVEYSSLVKVIFYCDSASYASTLKSSIENSSVSGSTVTVEFSKAVDQISYTLTGQVRMKSIVVYALPHAHTYTPVGGTPATCTTEGTKAHYKCSVCEKLFLEEGGAAVTESDLVIPTTEHTYTSIPEVPATCTATGTQAHYKCSVCKKLFLAEGGEEATAESLELPMISHNVESWTSNGDGTHSGTCTMCHETFDEYCNKDGTDEACSKCGFISNSISIELTNKSNSTVTWYKQDGDTYVLLGTGITNLPPSCNYAITVNLEKATSFVVTLGGTPVETKTDATLGTLYLIPVATEDISINITATFTVEMTSFTDVNGSLGDHIGYASAKGGASTSPAVYNNEIRLYQGKSSAAGGSITITADPGYVIKSAKIGSSMGTKITYTIDSDTTHSAKIDLAAESTYEKTDLQCESITFYCWGTSKNTRLYVNYLQVVYEI